MADVRIYRTVSGDTWDLISYKLFGTEGYYAELIRTNLKLINIAVFPSNVPVIVPDVDIKSQDTKEMNTLPPWRL